MCCVSHTLKQNIHKQAYQTYWIISAISKHPPNQHPKNVKVRKLVLLSPFPSSMCFPPDTENLRWEADMKLYFCQN